MGLSSREPEATAVEDWISEVSRSVHKAAKFYCWNGSRSTIDFERRSKMGGPRAKGIFG